MNSLVIIDTVASANDFLDNHYNDNQKYEIYSLHYSVVDFLESHNIKCIDFTAFITPNEAINEGSDFLVIGRPITSSIKPLESLKEILRSLDL